MEQYSQDIEELNKLIAITESVRIKALLQRTLHSTEQTLQQMQQVVVPPQPVVEAEPSDTVRYSSLDKFGWEDAGWGKEKVQVYIMNGVDGVGDLPKENISCDFTKSSFDLKIHGLNGNRNVRLVKSNLEKEIVPERCSYRVKANRVTLTLIKAKKDETWMNLTAKSTTSASKPEANPADPSAGLMDMMKNMYAEGDDNMKRTIAKAWTEGRDKSGNSDAMDTGMPSMEGMPKF